MPPPTRREQTGADTSGSFSCFLCEATGFSASGMERHIQSFHSSGSNSFKKMSNYPCIICAFSTSCEKDLQAHVNTEHSEQYADLLCESTFMSSEGVENHVTQSHAEDAQSCEDNGKTLVNNASAEDTMVVDSSSDEDESNQSIPKAAINSEQNKLGNLELPADKQEEPSSSDGVAVSAEVLELESPETSLRLTDCPAEYDDPTVQYHEHDEMNDLDNVNEDMDTDEKPTNACGAVPDRESNLSVILNSIQNRNNTKKCTTSDCSDMAVKVTEGSHGGARPKSITKLSASSSTDDLTETLTSVSPEGTEKYAHATDRKRSLPLLDGSVDSGPSYSCPLCSFQTSSECEIQCHVAQEHTKEEGGASADLDASSMVLYSCPFCMDCFDLPDDLSGHINSRHPDEVVGGGSSSHGWSDVTGSWVQLPESSQASRQPSAHLECPVCGFVLEDGSETLLSAHVSDHFASSPTSQGK